jgi:cytochrome c-type biogenesis protein CcmH/NrfG
MRRGSAPRIPKVADTLGRARLAEDDPRAALLAYDRARTLYAARTELRAALAHHRLGQSDQVLSFRRRARKLWPEIETDESMGSILDELNDGSPGRDR